jgi:hypothetical protein
MIAVAGYIKYLTKGADDSIEIDIDPNLRIN